MSPQQLESVFEWWKTRCDQNGLLSKAAFEQGLKEKFGITDPMILHQNFLAFDKNNDGYIDFREFVVGLIAMQQERAKDNLLRCNRLNHQLIFLSNV